MRELTYYVATSLDGRIAGPGGAYDGFAVEGDHLPHLVEAWRETIPTHVLDALGLAPRSERFDTVLMGWETYAVGLAEGVDSPYRHLRQVVFTREHADAAVPDEVELVSSDPVAFVRDLKASDGGGLWLCGGGTLASALLDEVDHLVLKVNPVLFGDGVPLVAPTGYAARRFALADVTRFDSGVVVLEHRRA